MTPRLRKALIDHGYISTSNSATNQLLPILLDPLVEQLSKAFTFNINSKPNATHTIIRLVTSWAIAPRSVGAFMRALD